MSREKLSPKNCALLVIDVQEKLFPHLDHECEFLKALLKMVKGAQILNVPILVTEQYPKGLGPTLDPLKNLLGPHQNYIEKTTFSCAGDKSFCFDLEKISRKQIILTGVEAHICVLQTAWDLVKKGYEVTVVNEAITSRSIYDFSTAIAEMRDLGIRITSVETVLFELLGDAKASEFKAISQLVQS